MGAGYESACIVSYDGQDRRKLKMLHITCLNVRNKLLLFLFTY